MARRRLILKPVCVVFAWLLPATAEAGANSVGNAPEVAAASEPASDKSAYHLIHPTPRALMRAMSTDRPDTTESPYSVDAGHFQLEIDAASVARDSGATDVAVGSFNLKLGLTSFMDLQLVFEPFHQVRGQRGVGNFTIRDKINLWGNDEGTTAFALMPFITLPTASAGFGSGHVEGGLIAPLGWEGPAGFSLGAMLEVDGVRRLDSYGADLVATLTAGHDLWAAVAGFAELDSSLQLDSGTELALGANSGLSLALSDDLILDCGVRVGLTAAADDLSVFVGGSARY